MLRTAYCRSVLNTLHLERQSPSPGGKHHGGFRVAFDLGNSEDPIDGQDLGSQAAIGQLADGIDEILNWLVTRLNQRAVETQREKDRDDRGQQNIIGWLNADKYTYEQKWHTLATFFPMASDAPEFLIVGEQLRRLRHRCFKIITAGVDPGVGQEFTFPIPTPLQDETIMQSVDSFVMSLEHRRTTNPPMGERFENAAKAILAVAKWIDSREFVV